MVTHTDGGITYTVTLEIKEMLEQGKRIEQALNELKRNSNNAAGGLDSLERSANSAGAGLGKLSNIAKAVSAALLSSKVIAYAESWNELEDRIQNTGATASQTKDILDQLLVTSDRNGRSINESAELYVRLSNSMNELGYSTQGTLSYIDTLSNLMTINKTNSLSAESAINALTKAQMKGKLAGIDAMTVFNAMPSILKTLANQMKKNAKSTEEADKITEQYVRELASKGKLSMEQFTQATIDAQEETARLANNMRNTVNDALTRVTNNLKKYFGELNNSSGATQLLVDSLILMSQHVDVLVNGIGALAAIYAGKYITSLASATKQSVEETIGKIRQAQATKVLIQSEIEEINQKIRKLEVQKKNIILAQTHCNSLRAQMSLNKQLDVIEKQLVNTTNELTAAQTRLNSAIKATSLTTKGLQAAMSLLGGPIGAAMLAGMSLYYFYEKAKKAKEEAGGLTEKVKQLLEQLDSFTDERLVVIKDEAIKDIKNAKDQLKLLRIEMNSTKDILEDRTLLATKGHKKDALITRNKQLAEERDIINGILLAQKQINTINDLLAARTGPKLVQTTKELAKNWDNAAKSEIDKKVESLSRELDIATLKAGKNSEAAFILEGLYSVLGDRANEYSEDLINLVTNQATVTKLTEKQIEALQPLIASLRSLSVENEKIKKAQKSNKETTKDYKEETTKLKKELDLLRKSYGESSEEAQIFRLEQETNTKVIGEERKKLAEFLKVMNGYKSLSNLENPIDTEKNYYNNAKAALDDWFSKNENKYDVYYTKLEKLTSDHQIKMAELNANQSVTDLQNAVAQVDPVQALENEHTRKLALIEEFEKQKGMVEGSAIALREEANRQYEQNRINAQWEIWRNQSDANEFLASSLEGLASSASGTISGLITGTMSAADAMRNLAGTILNEAIGSLVQMGMQYVKNAIIAKTASAATTTAQVGEAAALAIAYEPAAMLASIASFGAAADTGAACFATAIGSMKALSIAGARKNGGPVSGDSLYRVGEGGKPEILMQGNRQYLIPGENGKVLSNRQMQANQNPNIQWNFIVENYANGVEVSAPSVDFENRIVKTAVKQAKQEVANDISNHSGNVWRAMENSTNIHSKL